jgi:hypothetical protein
MEELVLKKVRGGLRGLKLGTKTIQEVNLDTYLDKLEKLNKGLYLDYLTEYNRIIENIKNK